MRLSGECRGVSEVIASLVMLLVVSLLGTTLYAYSQTTLNSLQESFQYSLTLEEERVKEKFRVLAVWWDGSDLLNITILNYGKIDISVDAIYIDNKPATRFLSGRGETVYTLKLVHVKLTSPVAIVEGRGYDIVVVSERGVRCEYLWTP